MPDTPPLRVYTNVLQPRAYIADLTGEAEAYQRTIRFQGGAWQGSFTLYGPYDYLLDWYYKALGYHFEEGEGKTPDLEFMIYELTLNAAWLDLGDRNKAGGISRRRSLDKLYNAVMTKYIDSTKTVQTSGFVTNDPSIAVYDRREDLLPLDNYEQTDAEARRDIHLKKYGWPRSYTVGRVEDEISSLQVGLCGYAFTGNWLYVTTADGSNDTASGWMRALSETDCRYLSPGAITENTLPVKRILDVPQLSWDTMMDIVERGDGSQPWRITVDPGRRLRYEPVGTKPHYYMRGGDLFSSAGSRQSIDPWAIRPGIVRDMDWPSRSGEYGGFLADNRDFVMDEVICGAESGFDWSTDEFDEEELLSIEHEYEAWLAGLDGGGKGSEHHIYELMGYKKSEWLAMSEAERLDVVRRWRERRRNKKRGR